MIIGIDPGNKGGICLMKMKGGIKELNIMPVVGNELALKQFSDMIKNWKWKIESLKIYIEHAHIFPGQGAAGMATYMSSFGMLVGVSCALSIPYELIKPVHWQRDMHRGINKKMKPKQKSLIAAERFFPEQSFLATPKCTKPHDGLIDAALIAEWGRRSSIHT